ncbi:MAG: polysaccharide deacetylase family protein [Planctomycetes bacterium]|nr:polysaccharide deacetylase family protein [Planctomycetota bacterium]
MLNAVSVDVEDYYQVYNFRGIDRTHWDGFESRVEASTIRVLDILDAAGVKGTFFCLGCVADQHPSIIRTIAERGHEVASHGWSHTPIWDLEVDAFREEVVRTRALLEDLSGTEVIGFRAPSFSVTERTRWALDVLVETGHRYDSSIFPVRHPDYGIPGSEEGIHRLDTPGGASLVEFPMTVARFLGRTIPVSGGGYFRLLPFSITRWGLRQANRKGRPAVFYLHPWEVDPDQPDLRDRTSRLGAFRHYTGLRRTEPRLRKLLKMFRFTSLRDVLERGGHL